MRLLTVLFAFSTFAHADTLEDCYLKGSAGGKTITIHWVYDSDGEREGFGIANSSTYGFCGFSDVNVTDSEHYGISCSRANGETEAVHYKRLGKGKTYVCNKGCGKHVARKLTLICEQNDNC